MRRRPLQRARGFTLLSVLLALVLVLTVLLTTLRESSEALSGATFHRDRELMGAAVDLAVAAGMEELNAVDGARLLYMSDVDDPAAPYNLFDNVAATDFLRDPAGAPRTLTYPPAGSVSELDGILTLRVGAVRGQRIRPPPGEDARATHGSIVHLQISVRADHGGTSTEQRYEVGVRVPEPASYQ